MKFLCFLLSVCALLVSPTCSAVTERQASSNVVSLDYSSFQGFFQQSANQTQFLGMRYAAPPLGNLRFRAPALPLKVTGAPVQATSKIISCPTTTRGTAASSPFHLNSKRQTGVSEDCLGLDVYIPGNLDPSRKLPVVFWIHGGGYAASDSTTSGQDLVRESDNQIIAVLPTYRLGLFGFLAGSAVKNNGDLNAGLLDQRLALQWVQKYIHLFGGDPTRVTIWGESAGAGSVMQHVVANQGNTQPPLFMAAMSCSTFLPSQYAFNHPIPEQGLSDLLSLTNCTKPSKAGQDVIDCLRGVDSATLQKFNAQLSLGDFGGLFFWVPVVDGSFIVESPTKTLMSGKHNGMAYRGNTNINEGTNFVVSSTVSSLQFYVANAFPNLNSTQVASVVSAYQSDTRLVGALKQAIAVQGEAIFICPTYLMLMAFGSAGYKSEFAIPPATHGQDVSYIFTSNAPKGTFNNTQFITSFSQSFLDMAISPSLDPNAKFDSGNISPPFTSWTTSNTEVQFNLTANGTQTVFGRVRTDSKLSARCALWRSLASFNGQ